MPNTSTGVLLCSFSSCFKFNLHAFLRRPWVFSGALGCGARRGPACTPRHKFVPRAAPVTRALDVPTREIWQRHHRVAEPRKTVEYPHSALLLLAFLHCCTATQPRYTTRASSFPCCYRHGLLHVCGHYFCVCAVCACVRVCAGLCMCVLALGRASFSTVFVVTLKCKHRLIFIVMPQRSLFFRQVVCHREALRHFERE